MYFGVFSFRKRKKSTGAKSGEYDGWGMITVLFSAKSSRASIDVWAGALSWFLHNAKNAKIEHTNLRNLKITVIFWSHLACTYVPQRHCWLEDPCWNPIENITKLMCNRLEYIIDSYLVLQQDRSNQELIALSITATN